MANANDNLYKGIFVFAAGVALTALALQKVLDTKHKNAAPAENAPTAVSLSDRIKGWERDLKTAEANNDYGAALKIVKEYIALRDPKDLSGIIVNGNPGADVYGDLTGDIDADGGAFMNRALEYGLGEKRYQKFIDNCIERKPSLLKVKYLENEVYKK